MMTTPVFAAAESGMAEAEESAALQAASGSVGSIAEAAALSTAAANAESNASASGEGTSAASGLPAEGESLNDQIDTTHTIGVLVYNYSDDETQAFANYLKGYISNCFNVEFVYSTNVTTQEAEMQFIEDAAAYGVEGILSFMSFDLAAEAELCAEKGMYYMMASGSVADEEFEAVSDNPYFLGAAGPGTDSEYEAGAQMAAYFAKQHYGDSYFILSGGGFTGNAMHLERTIGALDTLQETYGVSFDISSEELAMSAEPVHASAGDLEVCVCPGYLDSEIFLNTARKEYEKDQYQSVLSVLPGSALEQTLLGAKVGVIDCFSENNLQYMNSGELVYVAGKYGSLIGPSFIAMYNAITGYAENFREDGKAFHLAQELWSSSDKDDYLRKYILASSQEITAYNYEDLQSVCAMVNPDASLEDLKALAAACSYEDVVERRGVQ